MWDKSHECLKYTDSNITQNYIETVFEKWDGLKKGLKKQTNKKQFSELSLLSSLFSFNLRPNTVLVMQLITAEAIFVL